MKTSKAGFIHTLRFGWPPALGLATGAVLALLSPTSVQFRNTHAFYEIAFAVSFLAAAGYTVRLRPSASGGKKTFVWILNGVYFGCLLTIILGSGLAMMLAKTDYA